MRSRLNDDTVEGIEPLRWGRLAAKYWIDTGQKLLRSLCPNGVINAAAAADDDDENSISRFCKCSFSPRDQHYWGHNNNSDDKAFFVQH